MGGAIGFAIVTVAMNSYIKTRLTNKLSSARIESLLKTAETFKKLLLNVAIFAKTVFAQGYNLQMRIMIGFSAAQIPITLLMWKKKQISVSP